MARTSKNRAFRAYPVASVLPCLVCERRTFTHRTEETSHDGRQQSTSTHDDGLSAFLSVRPRLFGIAYRMLGSAAEAEDIVQDVWVRWQTTDRSAGSRCRGISRDDGDTSGDQRHAVGTLASGDVRRRLAAGTGRYQRRSPHWARNEARRWRMGCRCCWKRSRPPNEPPTSFGRRSTIPIARSRRSFGSKRPTHGKW